MPKLRLDSLKEGMVTAADVKNLDDMLLIPGGCELSARHIKLLRMWGVQEVAVEGPDNLSEMEQEDPLAQIPPEEARRFEKELKEKFWEFDADNPLIHEVYRLMLRRKARFWLEGQHESYN